MKLSWNRNTEPDIAGYKIFWGTDSGNYTDSVTVYDRDEDTLVKNYVITGLQPGVTFFVAIKAFDLAGHESDFSQEVVKSTTYPERINNPLPQNTSTTESTEEETRTFSNHPSLETDQLWGNDNIICTTPIDIDGNGVNEIAYLKKGNDSPDDMDIYIYTVPTTIREHARLVASDYWSPQGETISITNVDVDGDGIDEIAYLKRGNDSPDDMELYIYTSPTTIGEHARFVASDYWAPQGETISITNVDVDGDGIDEIAYLKKGNDSPDDVNIYIYTAPTTIGEHSKLVRAFLSPSMAE